MFEKIKASAAIILLAVAGYLVGLSGQLIQAKKDTGSIGTRDAYRYYHITAANASSTIQVSSNSKILGNVLINTTTNRPLSFYDQASTTISTGIGTTTAATSTATQVAILKSAVAEQSFIYDVIFNNGLVVDVPAGFTGDVTIGFK